MFLKKAFPIVQISRFPERKKTRGKGNSSESKRKQYMQASMDDFVIGERFCYDGKLMELTEVSVDEYTFSFVGTKKTTTLSNKWLVRHIKGIAHVVYKKEVNA